MPLRTYRACLVPACLALGALCALPTLAAPPAAPVTPAVQAAETQILVLNHVVPAEFIKTLSWNNPSALPAGVTQVLPLPQQNALAVTATPVGLAQVRKVVKLLDIEPRQAQIKYTLAHASDADLKAAGIEHEPYIAGLPAAHFLQTLAKQGAVTETGTIMTTNNVNASMTISDGPLVTEKLAMMPRIHSDNSITLALHPIFTDGAVTYELNTNRTIQSGGTMLFVISPPSPDGKRLLLLFVTPTAK